MAFIDRMKEARLNKGLTQEKLARIIGVAKSTYTGYEKGNSEPNMLILSKIMKALNIDANYLFQDEVRIQIENKATPYEMEKLVKKYRFLDQYGKETVDAVLNCEHKRCAEQSQTKQNISSENDNVIQLLEPLQPSSAGFGEFADDETAYTVTVKYNDITKKADYIMRVAGDSMEPKIYDGQRVLVRQQPAVEFGEIGIFIKEGERYIKIYRGDHLESANPDYPDVPLEEYSRCIGKVLGILKEEWIVK